MPTITFRVVGVPAPQGSKSYRGHSAAGHAILSESSKKVKPWRQDVAAAATQAMYDRETMTGPVCAAFTFFLQRPKSAAKKRRHPDRKPDLDKLVRSTMDALVTAGVMHDDAQVIWISAAKEYALGDPLGARISVWTAEGDSL